MSLLGSFAQLLGNAGHALGGVVQGVERQIAPQKAAPQQAARPQLKPNLLDAQHAFGTLVTQHTADQQKYTPQFRNLVQGTNPSVQQPSQFDGAMGAGGYYSPTDNRVVLKSNALDPYTVTHEGLHAAWQQEKPKGKAAFEQLVKSATPSQQQDLHGQYGIGNRLYNNASPDALLNETHSFLPQYNQRNQSQALTDYYQQYFANPRFVNSKEQQNRTRFNIDEAVGGFPKRYPAPQFDDWKYN